MSFDLRSLRHVVALGRLLSYTKAAKEVGLSQPALTRSIQVIEERSKVRLFDRDRGGVHLTPTGRGFVEHAAALLREAKELEDLLLLSAGADAGEIAFGMAPLPAKALLASALSRIWKTKPDLIHKVTVRPPDALLSLLLSEEIEFFVCADGQIPSSAPIKAARLGAFSMSVLVRPGHPLLARERQDKAHGFPLVVAGRSPSLEGVPKWMGFHMAGTAHVIEDYSTIAQLVQATDAVWFTATEADAHELQQGSLVKIPAPSDAPVQMMRIVMYTLDRRTLSPGAVVLKNAFERQMAIMR